MSLFEFDIHWWRTTGTPREWRRERTDTQVGLIHHFALGHFLSSLEKGKFHSISVKTGFSIQKNSHQYQFYRIPKRAVDTRGFDG